MRPLRGIVALISRHEPRADADIMSAIILE